MAHLEGHLEDYRQILTAAEQRHAALVAVVKRVQDKRETLEWNGDRGMEYTAPIVCPACNEPEHTADCPLDALLAYPLGDAMSDHETTLRAMAEEPWNTPDLRAACLAGADALRRGTCGTCHHGERLQMKPGAQQRIWCHIHSRHQPEDDGCIKGWAPREDAPEDAR